MTRAASRGDQDRRLDLDWVRIGAFGLLILYHVGMFYVPWSFHVKSPRVQDWLVVPMVLTNPWRLSLLFLVSGAATRFMAGKLGPGALARARTWRLVPPLVFGMLVVVPPQSWMQVVEAGWSGSYLEFWGRYLRADQGFAPGGHHLMLPTWNHLWFVPYLLAYTLVVCAWLALAPRSLDRLQAGLERLVRGPGALAWPMAAFCLYRLVLAPRFPETHTLVGDWDAHAVYLSAFLLGYLLARSGAVWAELVRLRWAALAIGAIAYVAYAGSVYDGLHGGLPDGLKRVMRLVYGVDQWAWMAAVLGFARAHLAGRDGPVRRYLTDAIFPFYIVHQTTIVVAAPRLARLGLPLAVEAAGLVAVTVASCVLTYEAVRRIGWLRPLFGLKSLPRATPAPRRSVGLPRLAEDCC